MPVWPNPTTWPSTHVWPGNSVTSGVVWPGGSVSAAAAPGLFVFGQSNTGTHDTSSAGWVADARVNLTWCNDGVNANGPAVQAFQNGGVGHSYELAVGAGMAAHYG